MLPLHPPPSFFLTILTRPPIFFLAQIHSLYDADRSSSCCPRTFTCRLHTITYHLHTFAFCHRTFACRPREGWTILLKSCIFQDSAGKKINKIPPNFFWRTVIFYYFSYLTSWPRKYTTVYLKSILKFHTLLLRMRINAKIACTFVTNEN